MPSSTGGASERDRIRSELGIGPDEPTALLLADPPVSARAKPFMFVIGIIEVAEVHAVGLIASPCGDYARSKLYYRGALMGAKTFSCAAPSVSLLHAADIAVLDPLRSTDREHRGHAGPSERALVAYAHRLGVPVVTPMLDGLEGLYPEDSRLSCVAHADRSSDVGRRIAPLLRDSAARLRLADRLKSAAEHWIASQEATDRVLRSWGAERAVASQAV